MKRKMTIGAILTVLFGSIIYIQTMLVNPHSASSTPVVSPILVSDPTTIPLPTLPITKNEHELQTIDYVETEPPIVLGYLENSTTIKFFCVNSEDCYQSIDLSQHIAKYADLTKWKSTFEAEKALGNSPISFDVHYISPNSIYILLFNYAGMYDPIILHVNPETNPVDSTILPLKKPWWEENYILANGNLVVFSRVKNSTSTSSTFQNILFTIHPDLSVSQVAIDDKCAPDSMMVEGSNENIILVKMNSEPDNFVRVCVVDTLSGEFIEKDIKIPNVSMVVSVSPNLEKFFYLYHDSKIKIGEIFGMYDTKTEQETTILDDRCINIMGGYQQYNGMLFSETFGLTEGNVKSTLIRMDDFIPVICGGENLALDMIKEVKIVPFGEYFLLGSKTQIILITLDGEIIDKFELPKELLMRKYQIMEYRN